MSNDQIQARAQQVYEQYQRNLAQYEAMGIPAPAHLRSTVDEIVAHMTRCQQIGGEYHVTLRWETVDIRLSDEAVRDLAASKAKTHRRSAGARAVKRKYGQEAAERIISSHAGRHITLQ